MISEPQGYCSSGVGGGEPPQGRACAAALASGVGLTVEQPTAEIKVAIVNKLKIVLW